MGEIGDEILMQKKKSQPEPSSVHHDQGFPSRDVEQAAMIIYATVCVNTKEHTTLIVSSIQRCRVSQRTRGFERRAASHVCARS